MKVRLQFSDRFHPELPLPLQIRTLKYMMIEICATAILGYFFFWWFSQNYQVTKRGKKNDVACQTIGPVNLVQGTQTMSMVSEVARLTPVVPPEQCTPTLEDQLLGQDPDMENSSLQENENSSLQENENSSLQEGMFNNKDSNDEQGNTPVIF